MWVRLRKIAVVGALVALALRLRQVVLPPRPDDAARPRVRRPADPDARPSPDGAGARIVVNPSSGPLWSGSPAAALREALRAADVVELSEGDDLEALLRDERFDVLGAAGGDGTLSLAATVAADRGVPLIAVPAGTLNHLARDLCLDDVDDAIAAVRAGTVTHMDLGAVDGRCFVNTLSFGGYPELVDARERREAQLGKWGALAVALVTELPRLRPLRLRLDGEEVVAWLGWIGNCRYDPAGFGPSWRERLDDGVLDVRLVLGGRLARTRFVAAVLAGRLATSRVYEERLVPSLVIESLDGPLRLAADGETFDGDHRIEVTKQRRALAVAVPPPTP